jgi:hypothetical protein
MMCRPRFGSLVTNLPQPRYVVRSKAPCRQTKKSAQEIDNRVRVIFGHSAFLVADSKADDGA